MLRQKRGRKNSEKGWRSIGQNGEKSGKIMKNYFMSPWLAKIEGDKGKWEDGEEGEDVYKRQDVDHTIDKLASEKARKVNF